MGGGASKGEAAVKINQVYKFKDAIGKGSFATVYEAELIDTNRKTVGGDDIPPVVAIKAIDKSRIPEDELPLLQDECNIMLHLSHPNCVGLLEFFDEPDFYYLVLELVKGGELFDQIVSKGYFNEVEAAHAAQQIAQSLSYLESKKIVHRDVKPENLIFESCDVDANIKLTDFGLAKDISSFEDEFCLTDPCGTPGYVAPEILQGKPYGSKVDTWALGVILFILLCGYPPFYSDDQTELFDQIKKGNVRFDPPYWDDVSQAAKNVILKLLVVDPKQRLSATALLQEPWVANPEAQNAKHFGDHVLEGLDIIRKQKIKRAIFKIKAMKSFDAITRIARDFGNSSGKDLNADSGTSLVVATTETHPGPEEQINQNVEPAQEGEHSEEKENSIEPEPKPEPAKEQTEENKTNDEERNSEPSVVA
mmetsp:Transcript_12378/g.22951  ORF Transcript_12378/g.22951 Transcript_12378/m.22951 type:complete len:421 (+) Transcript_12378:45-1307(+)|eukprot:CAMPEP_0184511680 /NCGR_PEP_ID=MMETSP0198_2-20121128/2479_1 /TAXON_ID=1112570 /ORGANISM="Thraustochytrium sp., Strain LLF1b" /LENGTH=420 /DNA_ID=CAMNT_0026901659 /DNA_START=26 /DNA_END=1288 /DNA_ORIENTATION=-